MEGSGGKDVSEITDEEKKKQLIEKWDCVFNPLSTNNKKALLLEPFTCWKQEYLCEFVNDNKQRNKK